jgi:hypothetical protein
VGISGGKQRRAQGAAPPWILLVGQRGDCVAFFGDLLAQVLDQEIRQVIGAILHFERALLHFPVGIRGFFRNGLALRYSQVLEFAVVFGSAIDVNAHSWFLE